MLTIVRHNCTDNSDDCIIPVFQDMSNKNIYSFLCIMTDFSGFFRHFDFLKYQKFDFTIFFTVYYSLKYVQIVKIILRASNKYYKLVSKNFNLNGQEDPRLRGGGMNCPSAVRLTFSLTYGFVYAMFEIKR